MPKAAHPPNLVVLIQVVHTHWEKSERGGARAVQRNQVPEAVKFPNHETESGPLSFVAHRVDYGGRNGFAEPLRSVVEVSVTEPTKLPGVSLAVDADTLYVSYQYSMSLGAPERYARKIEALRLSLNQWGRVCYNGRHSGYEGYWWYEKWVYNVGLFSSPPLSVFLTTKPVKVFPQMAHLL